MRRTDKLENKLAQLLTHSKDVRICAHTRQQKVAHAQKCEIRRYLSSTSHISSRDNSADRGQKVAYAQKHLKTENGVSAILQYILHTNAQTCGIRR
jgi:hypothetical protein